MTEDELRDLMGFGSKAQVSFAGQQWGIKPEAFAALLRYVRSSVVSQKIKDSGPAREAQLAALHHFLDDCVIDFGAFSWKAFETKAGLEELLEVSKQLVQFYCARPYYPAVRLLGYLSNALDEFDGDFLRRSGRGIATLSPREACNLALAICLDGRNEEDRQAFYDDLNYEGSPEVDAMEMVRKMRETQGKPPLAEADGAD